MYRMSRVYISGHMTHDRAASGAEIVDAEVAKAMSYAVELIRLGYSPFLPHLYYIVQSKTESIVDMTYTDWLRLVSVWIGASDAVLAYDDSPGASYEIQCARSYGVPVYRSIEDLTRELPSRMICTIDRALNEIRRIHALKAIGYGSVSDPYANIRASEEWGVPAWIGALMRGSDKIRRIQNLFSKSLRESGRESIRDNLIDLATYAIISLTLYEEEADGGN